MSAWQFLFIQTFAGVLGTVVYAGTRNLGFSCWVGSTVIWMAIASHVLR